MKIPLNGNNPFGGIFMKRHGFWPCACAGLAAGLLNGFFGAGGGMLLVPMLTRFAKLADKKAFPTAIAVMLPLSILSIVIYALGGALPLHASVPYLIGGAAGGTLGGLLFRRVSAGFLHTALGIVILFGGVRLILC